MEPSLQSALRKDAFFGIAHFDLAAVRVSAKRQVDPAASDTAKYDGVVGKQQLHLVGERTLERRFQIGLSDHVVVNSGKPKRSSASGKSHAFIYEHRDAFPAKQFGNELGIGPVVMVSKTCEFSYFETEPTENF